VEQSFQGGEVGLERSASDFRMALPDVGFDLLFPHLLGRHVAAVANEAEDGPNVNFLGAGYESGEGHVFDETLA